MVMVGVRAAFRHGRTPDQEGACAHCGSALKDNTGPWCCHGCRLARQMIEGMRLDRFYDLVDRQIRPVRSRRQPVDPEIFDSPWFRDNRTRLVHGKRETPLRLNGLTCYACVWVCREALRKTDDRAWIDINMSTARARLYTDPDRPVAPLVNLINRLGYSVGVDTPEDESPDQSLLLSLGVAWFCFGNIMLLAFAEYFDNGSMTDSFRALFHWISAGLAAMCLGIAGRGFFREAWNSIRQRRLSIDLPLALALAGAFILSLVHTIRGEGAVYFDSLTGIIALVLTGRMVQSMLLRRARRLVLQDLQLPGLFCRRLVEGGKTRYESLQDLQAGETLRLLPGESLPVEGRLVNGPAVFSLESIRGEADPVRFGAGDLVPGGALCLQQPVDVLALEPGAAGVFAGIEWQTSRLLEGRARLPGLAHRLATAFTVVVVGSAGAALCMDLFWLQTSAPFSRALATLLVACPCVFGLGLPLVMSRTISRGIGSGVLFKNPEAIENLAAVREISFDKTGTLTHREPEILCETLYDDGSLKAVLPRLAGLDQHSSHYAVRALAAMARDRLGDGKEIEEPRDFTEVPGAGVRFIADGREVLYGRREFAAPREQEEGTWLVVDGRSVLNIRFSDLLRDEAPAVMDTLRKAGADIRVLSGDLQEKVDAVMDRLGMDRGAGRGGLMPGEKQEEMMQRDRRGPVATAMVGDGLNDALAHAGATVGVAVAGADDLVRSRADIVLTKRGLRPLLAAIATSRFAVRRIKQVYGFALAYNLLAIPAALLGWVSPLVAALAMPFSSMLVILIALRPAGRD